MLPATFEEALKWLKPFLVPLHTFNVCPNACIVYRKQYESETTCPFCGCNRYDVDGKTALKNFSYFPLTLRIRRMLATKNIYELFNQHKNHTSEENVWTDIQDSKIWKEVWFGNEGVFSADENGIVLTLCLDGVNPFKQHQIDYSMWPIEISIDNLPPKIGSQEPKSLEPYMAILVDELLELQNCKMFDFNDNPIGRVRQTSSFHSGFSSNRESLASSWFCEGTSSLPFLSN